MLAPESLASSPVAAGTVSVVLTGVDPVSFAATGSTASVNRQTTSLPSAVEAAG